MIAGIVIAVVVVVVVIFLRRRKRQQTGEGELTEETITSFATGEVALNW